jgi:hypothetical protein
MSWMAAAILGSSVIGGVVQSKAASSAAGAQTEAAEAGIAEQRRQFDLIQGLLEPYVGAGESALLQQMALGGMSGPEAQQAAIAAIEGGQEFETLTRSGEEAILQNASATGGLRGGNVQSSLAQFRPQVLSSLINQQYGRLGGLTTLGQNAAVGTGNAGMQTGANIAELYGQQGAAAAGSALASGRAWGNVLGGIGQYAGGISSGIYDNPFGAPVRTLPLGASPTTSMRPPARPF